MPVLEICSRTIDAVQITCIVFCAALLLGRPIRQLGIRGGLRSCIGGLVAHLRSLSRRASSMIACSVTCSQDAVRKHELSMRTDLAGRCCHLVASLSLLFLPVAFFIDDDRDHATPRRLYMCVVVLVSVVLHVFPSLMTPQSLHVWYSVIATVSVLTMSPLFQSAESIVHLRPYIVFDCMISIVMDMCLPVNMMWTAIQYMVAVLTVVTSDFSNNPCLNSNPTLVTDVLRDWCLVNAALVMFNAGFCQVARFQLEGKTSRSELRAAKSILAGVCDAVAELDAELRLSQPAQGLATVLMLHPSRMLAGEKLTSLIPSEADRKKLVREVTSRTNGDGFCKAFHVSMRDSRGIAVPMEVFCVRVHSCDNKEYLLGFREFADTASAMPQPTLRALKSDVQGRRSSVTEKSSTCTYERETSQESTLPHVAVCVWFDALSPELTMLCCSSAFEAFVGCPWEQICGLEQSLLRCARPDQRDDFRYWISYCVSQFDENADESSQLPLSVNKTCFRFSKHHHLFRLAIQNRVTLVLTPQDGEHWPVGAGQPSRVAKLVLDRPKWIQDGRCWGGPVASSLSGGTAVPPGGPGPEAQAAPAPPGAPMPGPDAASDCSAFDSGVGTLGEHQACSGGAVRGGQNGGCGRGSGGREGGGRDGCASLSL
ncbi:unnamed protein product [Prorocentrum cordatum]|uniref:PAS domain-containing protein n=1 Tax=Prorocentrum cordatum TaxID=2364126 RepID=A0ABN9PWG3_9DINO|nr:unnamed protein product [Polarella glacialis]